ncbi:MAG TPA: Gfo/Idh/MocA family oxidoreductase [Dongiaceae bacterium]|jgi:predicted dehydrogenase|nr:Gfo/Idh/MocA family oxidoreductase [Dongiaceae bacterium]
MLIRIGFIGLGEQGRENLLPALTQVQGAKIVCLCDSDRDRAASVAARLGDLPVYSDASTMMAEAELDAIVMACPPQAHYTIALEAFQRGLHVFVEKPPCLTTAQLIELIEAARTHRVITGIGLNFRFATPVKRLNALIKDKYFGRPVHAYIDHAANKPTEPMWGLDSLVRSFLLAQAIHSIDLQIMIGGQLKDVYCTVQKADTSILIDLGLGFESGVRTRLITGNMFPYFDFNMRIVGDNSHVVHLDSLRHLTVKQTEKCDEFIGDPKRWVDTWHPGPLDSGYSRSGYLGELEAFMDALRSGKKFEADFQNMLQTFQVIDAIEQTVPLVIDTPAADDSFTEKREMINA